MAIAFPKAAKPSASNADGKPMPPSLMKLKGLPAPIDEPLSLDAIVNRIESRRETCLIATGKDLLKAKEMLAHGAFQPWLKANFGWSLSQAQNFMNIAKDPKSAHFADFPKAAQYALAAPSTPGTVKDKVIADLGVGNNPSVEQVKTAIKEAKPPKPAKPNALDVVPVLPLKGSSVGTVLPKSALPITTHLKSMHLTLVARLKSVGLEAALEAVEAAFPNADITVDLSNG